MDTRPPFSALYRSRGIMITLKKISYLVAESGGFCSVLALGDDADDGFGIGGAEVDPRTFQLAAEVEFGAVANWMNIGIRVTR